MKKLFVAIMMLLGLAGTASAKDKVVVPPPAPVSTIPAPEPDNILVLDLSTGGQVRIQLRPDKAPGHIERIKLLTRAGFYDGVVFHRVIEGFMAQTGDPQGTGEGGSPLPDLKAEFNDLPHLRGALSMARTSAPDSANSQFFIVFSPTLRLDGKYTVLGRVMSGMQYVDAIERGEPPLNPSKVVRAWIGADGPDAPRVPLPQVSAKVEAAPATTPQP